MNVMKRFLMKTAAKSSSPMMKHNYAMWGTLCKAFYEKYGKGAIPIITEVSGKSGVGQAEIIQKMMPVKNMKDVGELFKITDSMMESGMEIIELTDDAIHFKLSHYTCGIEGTSQELCEAIMTSDNKMLSTLLGQEVETEIIKSVAVGDKECEVIHSRKVKKNAL